MLYLGLQSKEGSDEKTLAVHTHSPPISLSLSHIHTHTHTLTVKHTQLESQGLPRAQPLLRS